MIGMFHPPGKEGFGAMLDDVVGSAMTEQVPWR